MACVGLGNVRHSSKWWPTLLVISCDVNHVVRPRHNICISLFVHISRVAGHMSYEEAHTDETVKVLQNFRASSFGLSERRSRSPSVVENSKQVESLVRSNPKEAEKRSVACQETSHLTGHA